MIRRFKLWNEWRKNCLNGHLHKFLVLIGLVRSPTFHLFVTFKDWELKYPDWTIQYEEEVK